MSLPRMTAKFCLVEDYFFVFEDKSIVNLAVDDSTKIKRKKPLIPGRKKYTFGGKRCCCDGVFSNKRDYIQDVITTDVDIGTEVNCIKVGTKDCECFLPNIAPDNEISTIAHVIENDECCNDGQVRIKTTDHVSFIPGKLDFNK